MRLPPGHSSCKSGHSASGTLKRMLDDVKPCPEPWILRKLMSITTCVRRR